MAVMYDRISLLSIMEERKRGLPSEASRRLRYLEISKIVSGSVKKMREGKMEFRHLNICGILRENEFEYIRQLLLNNPSTILALTESHLRPDYPMQLVQVTGFKCFRRD